MMIPVHAIIITTITRKCYSIGRAKASSTQAALYCATTLNQVRLHVDIIVLNFNESVTFARCVWPPGDQIDVHLNIYINQHETALIALGGSLCSQLQIMN